jgi:hypothetical protein
MASSPSGQEPVPGYSEHSNARLGFINVGNVSFSCEKYQLFEDFAPCS